MLGRSCAPERPRHPPAPEPRASRPSACDHCRHRAWRNGRRRGVVGTGQVPVLLAASALASRDHHRASGQFPRTLLRPDLRRSDCPCGPRAARRHHSQVGGRLRNSLRASVDRLVQRLAAARRARPGGHAQSADDLPPDVRHRGNGRICAGRGGNRWSGIRHLLHRLSRHPRVAMGGRCPAGESRPGVRTANAPLRDHDGGHDGLDRHVRLRLA
jgi:hypothetical protein